jgi:hypothetical protein
MLNILTLFLQSQRVFIGKIFTASIWHNLAFLEEKRRPEYAEHIRPTHNTVQLPHKYALEALANGYHAHNTGDSDDNPQHGKKRSHFAGNYDF